LAYYKDIYESWKKNPLQFWDQQSNDIDWIRKPKRILDDENIPFYKWFPDGVLNTCFNAIDRHVIDGRGEQDAIIYDSPITNVKQKISYSQLLFRVSQFSGALRKQGVEKSDRVIIYMPIYLKLLLPC